MNYATIIVRFLHDQSVRNTTNRQITIKLQLHCTCVPTYTYTLLFHLYLGISKIFVALVILSRITIKQIMNVQNLREEVVGWVLINISLWNTFQKCSDQKDITKIVRHKWIKSRHHTNHKLVTKRTIHKTHSKPFYNFCNCRKLVAAIVCSSFQDLYQFMTVVTCRNSCESRYLESDFAYKALYMFINP